MINKAKKIVDISIIKKIRISIAESCTGGMLCTAITSVPGSSKVFDRGFITYSYKSKVDLLNVSPHILKKQGAVSQEVAIEMVKGVVKNSDANLAVAITGIAGPAGATKHKPIGLVYIATSLNGKIDCQSQHFNGNRDQIRKAACRYALKLLLDSVENL